MRRPFFQREDSLMDGSPTRTRSIYAAFLRVQANHHRDVIRCRMRPSGHDFRDITMNVRETHRNDDGTIGGKAGEEPRMFSVSVERCADCGVLSTRSVVDAMRRESQSPEDNALIAELATRVE